MMKHRLLFLLLILGLLSCHATTSPDNVECEPDDEVTVLDTLPILSLVVVGDMMQHAPQFKAAYKGNGIYDYTDCFAFVKDDISNADVAIANLETTLAGIPYSGYPQFCSPDAFVKAIQDAGFDILLTANNHSVDRRAKGICRTIQVLDSLGIAHLGTYADTASRRVNYPYLLECKGFRIVLLNYTYGTNGIKVPTPCVVNMLDTVQMACDIAKAKQMDVDAIIAFPHWGNEYQMTPSKSQRELADWMLGKGVTHIVGGHPHVCQPIEVRKDSLTGQHHLVAFSLGNYISNMTNINCTGGISLRLVLSRDSLGKCVLKDVDYSLVWCDRPVLSGKRVHQLYPQSYPDTLLNRSERFVRDSFVANALKMFKQR